MQNINNYKERLDESLKIVHCLLDNEGLMKKFISANNHDEITKQIMKKITFRDIDAEIYDLKNKVEIIGMLETFLKHLETISHYSSELLMEELDSMDQFLSNYSKYIDNKINELYYLPKSVGEVMFRELRKEYQEFIIFKRFHSEIINNLEKFDANFFLLTSLVYSR